MNSVIEKLSTMKAKVEELLKWERQGSMTAVNREAHYQALAAVKDHVLKYISGLLRDMKDEEVKHVPIAGCELTVRKIMADMYSGTVRKGTQLIHQFDRTTIPQLAGQLQSLLELYDPATLVETETKSPNAMLADKLKPLAENAQNGMVSQLLTILAADNVPTQAVPVVSVGAEVAEIIAEANAITDEAKRRMQTVDPKAEIMDLKERVEAMLSRVESLVSAQAPTSQGEDKMHDTLHQMQQKHDFLADRAQQELNILNDKIKKLTDSLGDRKPSKTITITVD